jgi:hypothetical protein
MTEIRHIETDPETVIVIADELDHAYQRTDSGDDVVGLLIEDPTLGHFCVALSIDQATDIATNLSGMVANMGQIRAEWDRDHRHE